jgi:hypothetical protein
VVRVTGPARRWLLAAAAALIAAWMLAPSGVPIYDGLQNPDEPYRWVSPPAGSKQNGPPTSATATVAVRNGLNNAAYANSHESGPQISVYLPPGAFHVPAGASAITLTATPVAASSPLPTDGTIWSNVYRITATAGAKSVPVTGSGAQAPTIQMRAPSGQQPGPVFEHRISTGWQQSKTLRIGNDIYQTQATALGDWALVRLAHPASGTGGGGVNVGLLVAGIVVLVVAGLLIAIRISRTRRAAG